MKWSTDDELDHILQTPAALKTAKTPSGDMDWSGPV